MRLSVLIPLLLGYVVGCLAVAFAAVSGLELIVGDMGSLSVPIFAATVLLLVFQATWLFNLLMMRRHATAHARTEQLVAVARERAAELPTWSDKSELEAALRHTGLGEWAPRLAELARPCILLVPAPIEEDAGPIGATRLGGQPDMPADLDWPLRAAFQPKSAGPSTGPLERLSQSEREVRNREWPLSFVAQIDFAELHAVSALDGFPSTGRLLFFCDAFDWPWGEQEDQARAHVIFTQAPRERLERKPFPPAFDEPLAKELMPRGYGFKPRRLRPMAWLLPPRPAFIGQYDWPDWTVADDEACRQFWYAVYARWPETFGLDGQAEIHQMGGIALSIQEPVETACAQYAGEGPASADDWQLVLQIDSDIEAGMEWGDSGRLYVCARKQDLGAARFDRCWTILQCY